MKGPASFSVVLGDFRCDVARREIQASSGNSDSANCPGYEAVKDLVKQESVRKCPRSFLGQNLFHSVAFFPLARRIMVYFRRMSEVWFPYGAAAWLAQLTERRSARIRTKTRRSRLTALSLICSCGT